MPIVLLRVDERLIHGQVVVGWGNHLHPDRIVVADDDLAVSAWEQELYVLGLPANLHAAFVTVDQAAARIPEWSADHVKTMVLTRDVATMRRIAESGTLAHAEINVGGIHYAPGRSPVLPYVYLSDAERAELRLLASHVARITAKDVPGAKPVDLVHLVRERSA